MILLEQLFFYIIALALFVIIFFKIIQRNDTSYIISLVIETIGILLNFILLLLNINTNIILKIFIYLIAIILPLAIILVERKDILFLEVISILGVKIYKLFNNNKITKKILLNLIEKYPESYIGHKLLAEIYEQEGGMRKAIDEYVQVIENKKNDYNSYYKIAYLLNDLNKKDEAEQMLNTLLAQKPDYIEATKLLGEILISSEKYKEAANLYSEALIHNPTDYDLNYNLGIVYTMLNDFQSAKNYYEKAAMLNSLEYNSKYSLAEIALIFKELDEAERYFIETSQDEDLEADSYYELAKINLIKGNKDKAINYANISIECDPNKIILKIKQEPIFMTIFTKLTIPLNLENIEPKENKLTKKEKMAKERLEHTFEITKNLGYTDIKMSKNDETINSIENVEKDLPQESETPDNIKEREES